MCHIDMDPKTTLMSPPNAPAKHFKVNHLDTLPIAKIIGREYRQREDAKNAATRGNVTTISAWRIGGSTFIKIHGENGTRKEEFDLNVEEGTWHQEPSDDIVLTMKSGQSFIFFSTTDIRSATYG